MTSPDRPVAIIGAGPAGLVAARFLKAAGFTPILLDRGPRVGGQWDSTAATSGVWSAMWANTSRTMTRFSDLDHPEGTPAFPHNAQIRAYLEAYAARFGLLEQARFGTIVTQVAHAPEGGYRLRMTDASGRASNDAFARVVVATGRHNAPNLP